MLPTNVVTLSRTIECCHSELRVEKHLTWGGGGAWGHGQVVVISEPSG